MILRCPGCRSLFKTEWIGDTLQVMCDRCTVVHLIRQDVA
jgi:hypothetical protein